MKRSHKVVKTVVKSVAKPDSMTVVKHIVVEQTVVKQLVVRQIVVKFQWSSRGKAAPPLADDTV